MAGANVYVLKGGPCDGKKGELSPPIDQSGVITCQNHIYKRSSPLQLEGAYEVFNDSGVAPNPSPPVPAPKLHNGWNSLRRTMNRHLPAGIKQARRDTDAALRTLGRMRKVKG